MISRISEALASQVWFQELKSKWEQIDSTKQNLIKYGSMGAGVLTLVIFIISFGVQAMNLKKDIAYKNDILKLLVQANEEIKSTGSTDSNGAGQMIQWKKQLDILFGMQSVNPAQVEWVEEKRISSNDPNHVETWVEFKLKDIELKQLVRLSVGIETHQPPLKIRLLEVDSTKTKGRIIAHFAVSGFEVKP